MDNLEQLKFNLREKQAPYFEVDELQYLLEKNNGDVRKGLAELLSNLSYLSEISHMRKVQSPEKKNGSNLTAPRRLHESNYGMTCLNETPEGDKVGLVKYFAMTCNISEYIQEYKIHYSSKYQKK